jgi:hypothetical protein
MAGLLAVFAKRKRRATRCYAYGTGKSSRVYRPTQHGAMSPVQK